MSSEEVITLNKKPLDIDLGRKKVDEPAPPAASDADNVSEPAPAPQFDLRPIQPIIFDDPKAKYSAIFKINEYFNSPYYGKAVAHLRCNLHEKSLAELDNLLIELDAVVNSSASFGLTKDIFYESISVAESILKTKSSWKANGLTQALRANERMDMVIERLRLKYAAGKYVPPELEVTAIIFATLKGVDTVNRAAEFKEELDERLKREVLPDQQAKYKEL